VARAEPPPVVRPLAASGSQRGQPDDGRAAEGHDDLRDGIRAIRLIGVRFGASDPEVRTTLEAVRRGPRGSGPGARVLTAMTALAVALGDGTAAEASALAREAFADGDLDSFEVTASTLHDAAQPTWPLTRNRREATGYRMRTTS